MKIFLSHSSEDAPVAKDISLALEGGGHQVFFDKNSLPPAGDYHARIRKAVDDSDALIFLISPDSVKPGRYTLTELKFAQQRWPHPAGLVMPVMIRATPMTQVPTYLRAVTILEPEGNTAAEVADAVRNLRAAYSHTAEQDDTQRRHPVDPQGALSTAVQQPRISQIPHPRNPNFIGRGAYLERLYQELKSGKPAAVTQAIAGLGGIGKTQLALEYSYRYSGEYNVIWWVRSEQKETRLGDLQALGQALGQGSSGMEVSQIITATVEWLDHNDNWLLVFDNVEHPSHIRDLLPKARRGHIIITSRYAAWQEVAQTVSLALWSSDEAISYLSKRTGQQKEMAAAAIAKALGYLPLALVQAAAYIEETGCGFAHYLELLQAHPVKTLGLRPAALDAEKVIATIWEIAFQRVAETNPRAVDLLNLFAFLPPDRIPRRLLAGQANRLPVSLAETVQNPFVLDAAITVLRSYSLIDTTEDAFSVHRLVQVAVQGRLDNESHRRFYEAARDLQDSPSALPEWEIDRKSSRAGQGSVAIVSEIDGGDVRVRSHVDRTFWWRPLYIVLALVILSGLSGVVMILVKTDISSWRKLIPPSPPIEDEAPEEPRERLINSRLH